MAGELHEYDHVILATHSDTSLKLLRAGKGIHEAEERILGGVGWSKNRAVLHSDTLVSATLAPHSCCIETGLADAEEQTCMELLELPD